MSNPEIVGLRHRPCVPEALGCSVIGTSKRDFDQGIWNTLRNAPTHWLRIDHIKGTVASEPSHMVMLYESLCKCRCPGGRSVACLPREAVRSGWEQSTCLGRLRRYMCTYGVLDMLDKAHGSTCRTTWQCQKILEVMCE